MKTVIEMAEAVGITDWTIHHYGNSLEDFAELVRADERARMAEQPAQQRSINDMKFGGCPFCGSQSCVAGQCQRPAQQEPVAQWQKRHPHHWEGKWENTNEHDAKWWRDNSQGWEIRPLYTSPPAHRKPLTDEQIWKFWWSRPEVPEGEDDSMEAEFVAAVRRVLAAHNIKENT